MPEKAIVQRLVYPQLISFEDSEGLSSDLSLAGPYHTDFGVDDQLVSISSGTERVQHKRRGVVVEFRGHGANQVGGARKEGGATDGLNSQRAEKDWRINEHLTRPKAMARVRIPSIC